MRQSSDFAIGDRVELTFDKGTVVHTDDRFVHVEIDNPDSAGVTRVTPTIAKRLPWTIRKEPAPAAPSAPPKGR